MAESLRKELFLASNYSSTVIAEHMIFRLCNGKESGAARRHNQHSSAHTAFFMIAHISEPRGAPVWDALVRGDRCPRQRMPCLRTIQTHNLETRPLLSITGPPKGTTREKFEVDIYSLNPRPASSVKKQQRAITDFTTPKLVARSKLG